LTTKKSTSYQYHQQRTWLCWMERSASRH